MSDFKIESDVPIPGGYMKKAKYPFGDMKVGDSFLVNDGSKPETVYAAAYTFADRQSPKWKFHRRSTEQGVRIWRVE